MPLPHAFVHEPQALPEVARFASHPFAALPSQSAKPLLHSPTPHIPAEQTPVALAGAHDTPHAPQFAGEFAVSVSQPFTGSPSQSSKPGLHVTAHAWAVQMLVWFCPAGHARPHAPQFCASARTDSHPFTGS
jgi:hypothetical protein